LVCYGSCWICYFFFFQAEDGIRVFHVTGVQTCALPISTCDCLHDMTDPAGMARTIRAAVADDGTWLLIDIKAYDTYAENVARNQIGRASCRERVSIAEGGVASQT